MSLDPAESAHTAWDRHRDRHRDLKVNTIAFSVYLVHGEPGSANSFIVPVRRECRLVKTAGCCVTNTVFYFMPPENNFISKTQMQPRKIFTFLPAAA